MTFEEWYVGYNPAHKSDKDRAEDAWKAATQRCLDIFANGEQRMTWKPMEQASKDGVYHARDEDGQEVTEQILASDWTYTNKSS